jgi:hypothetical protein
VTSRLIPLLPAVLLLVLFGSGCSIEPQDEEREEIVGGVMIPIPKGMNKSTEQRVELTLPGLNGAQVSYQGHMDPREIVGFYQREMAARAWNPKASLVAEGGALAYTKDNRSLLITIGRSEGYTTLTILVGVLGS